MKTKIFSMYLPCRNEISPIEGIDTTLGSGLGLSLGSGRNEISPIEGIDTMLFTLAFPDTTAS